MNIMLYPLISKIYFGNNAAQAGPRPFQKEYDEIVLKSAARNKQRNHRVSAPSFLDFHKKMDIFVDAFKDCGLTKKAYVKAVLKIPMLICSDPQTLIKNIEGVVSRFEKENLKKKDYLKACLKQPQLMLLKPETIENNIRELARIYSDYGLSEADYLKMALKHPSLFSQKPQTISKNIDAIVKRYKNSGLSTEEYIKMLKRYPVIATLSPNSIEKNIAKFVEKYSKYGLDEKQYIKMLKYSPIGLCINPDNKISSIDKLINSFKNFGMTEEKCIKMFIRQPLIFFNNFEKLTKRINFYTFVESEKMLDQGISTINNFRSLDNAIMKNLSYSEETNFIIFLRDKLRYCCGVQVTYRNLKENMKEFIKNNSSSEFEFKVSKSEFTEAFIKFIDQYSKEIVNKNIFKIIVR